MTRKIDDYCMQGASLVRIAKVVSSNVYDIEYIQITREDGIKAIGRGSALDVPEGALASITDPKFVVASEAHKAGRRYEDLDKALDAAWADVLKWNGVLLFVLDGNAAGVQP